MPSSLTWLDYDPDERERVQQLLALFQVRETRDELGLGAIRDSFADQMFPGTSTIQTRLRYMLFVPWMYVRFEKEQVPSREIAARGREFELALVEPLMEEDDPHGVFGRTARGSLKRLPSSVYWAGLRAWDILKFDRSRDRYHQALDRIYRLRADRKEATEEVDLRDPTITWHPKLPAEPEGFPDTLGFRLSREEAEFLVDRIANSQRGSLLARLARAPGDVEVAFPWQHRDRDSFDKRHRELLHHARLFSETMRGAAILYNLLLAQELPAGDRREKLLEERSVDFTNWASSLDEGALHSWQLDQLWQLVIGHGHAITMATRRFVGRWVDLAISGAEKLADNPEAQEYIRSREKHLKGPRARFGNPSALQSWNGRAGMDRLSYRWPIAKSYLIDLREALQGE